MTDLEKDASEAILSLRPSFTIGWRSTALCESLRHGIVPISLSNKENTKGILDHNIRFYTLDAEIVYPFKKRTLSWKEEKERIFELLEDMSLYTKTLSELRMR